MKSTRKMLPFHEPHGHGTTLSTLKYVAVSDVHRIDEIAESMPVYKDGTRALIRGRGRDGFVYHATETPSELVALIEAAS